MLTVHTACMHRISVACVSERAGRDQVSKMLRNRCTATRRHATRGLRGSVRVACVRSRHAAGKPASIVRPTLPAAPCTTSSPVSVRQGRCIMARVATTGLTQAAPAVVAPSNINCKIYTDEGAHTTLEVLLSFVDKDQRPVGAVVDLSTFGTPVPDPNQPGGIIYQGQVDVPQDACGELVIMKVKADASVQKEYINRVEVTPDSDGDGHTISFAPNSWLHKAQGSRFFFASGVSLLPKQTPPELVPWRTAELSEIQGSLPKKVSSRDDWDRVWDYDVYNDLAGDNGKGGLYDRPVLGGSELPYPRRIRTGRPLIRGPSGKLNYETRDTGSKGPPALWVPMDERFNTVKETNFKLYGLLASMLPEVAKLVADKLPSKKLDSFAAVDSLYAEISKPSFTVSEDDLRAALKADNVSLPEQLLQLVEGKPDDEVFNVPGVPELAGLQAGAVRSSVLNIAKLVGGVQNLLTKFPSPLVDDGRDGKWDTDEEWGRQALAGVNPCIVRAVSNVKQLGAITEAHLAHTLQNYKLQDLLAVAGKEPRLLFIDHTAVFSAYAKKITATGTRYGHSGRAVLFQRDDKQWVPAAIELTGSEGVTTVYTPKSHPNVWRLAKGIFSSVDSGFHQLITHWLRCHACTEPYIIATNRCLSSLHPVYKLMMPHWRFTPQINANARSNLISAGGVIEQAFTPGPYAFEMSAKVYDKLWFFDKQGLPADLMARGLAKKGADGKFKLLLKDYPYADDGMLIWDAVHEWVGKYLCCYYDDAVFEKSIMGDEEIQQWWWEIRTKGHPDKAEGWPNLSSIADLTEILTTMIWVASAHHAAINFSQYGYSGYYLNRSTVCTRGMPQKDTAAYQRLVGSEQGGEQVYIETLTDDNTTMLSVLTVELLSTHADNEAYLGDPNHPYILDDKPRALYAEFAKKMKTIEETINARNKNPDYKLRNAGGNKDSCAIPYEFLAPSSGPGISNRGVPQSVSI